jgi:AraC-like DNA-binding protein
VIQLKPRGVDIKSQDEKFLNELVGAIEKNLSDSDLNIDALCKELLISRSTLLRKMKKITGESPNQFIQNYRLKRAAQLLEKKYGNVTEVAKAVGFSEPYYFSKCFKNKYSQSPKAYQLSHLKNVSSKRCDEKTDSTEVADTDPHIRINIEVTLEDLDRELVLRLPLPKLEKLFNNKMGTPQRSEIYESIKNFYDSVAPPASNKALKDMTPLELLQKMRMAIDDLKEDSFK